MFKKPSLQKIANEMGISKTYLHYLLNGKRHWTKDLYDKYYKIVASFQEIASDFMSDIEVVNVHKDSSFETCSQPDFVPETKEDTISYIATHLKSATRKGVWVRFPPSAPALNDTEKPVFETNQNASSVNVVHRTNSPDLIHSFIQDRQARQLSDNTIKFYYGYLYRFLCQVNKNLLEINQDDIILFLRQINCTPGGKSAYLRSLKAFYRWAKNKKLISLYPCDGLTIKVPQQIRHIVDLSIISVLLKECQKTENPLRNQLIILMYIDTGLRLSELASIERKDLDINNCVIQVIGKGNKYRKVKYGLATSNLLKQWLQQSNYNNRLFGLKPRGISSMLTKLEKKTGIKCNAHAFRRTFATESIRNGTNLFHVQSLLGHNSLTMTRIYSEQVSYEDAINSYKPIIA